MSNILACCGVRCNNEFEDFSMSGYYTDYNECAALVTAPVTIDAERQRDTRCAIAAVEESDGAK